MQSHPVDEVTVVVVTWRGARLIGPCLDSLAAQTVPHSTLVIDNDSTDGTDALLRERFPEVEVVRMPTNTGFAGGVHAALDRVSTRFVALLNDDATADPRWLEHSIRQLQRYPDAAAVTARMLLTGQAGVINNVGVLLLRTGYGADRALNQSDGPAYDAPAEVFGFSGGAAVLRTLAVQAVGGIEPSYFLYYEDADLAWRLRLAGWSVHYCPDAVVRHQHAASTRRESEMFTYYNERNRLLMLLRCAPAGFVAACAGRFVLTTASLTAKRLLGRRVPAAHVFSPMLRIRILLAAVRRAPWALRSRASVSARSRVSRKKVLRQWLDRDSLPLQPTTAGTR